MRDPSQLPAEVREDLDIVEESHTTRRLRTRHLPAPPFPGNGWLVRSTFSRSGWGIDPASSYCRCFSRMCGLKMLRRAGEMPFAVQVGSARSGGTAIQAGVMLGFIWNRFVGSYRAFSCRRRPWLDPYEARIFSGGSSEAMWLM